MMKRIVQACALCLTMGLAAGPLLANELELATGEVLHGELVDITPTRVIFQHALLGEINVPLEDVRQVRTGDDEAVALPQPEGEDANADATDAIDEPVDEIEPAEASFFDTWDGSLSLGFSGTDGDTRTTSFNTQFRATQENDHHRWLLDAGYFYGRDRSDVTQNEFRSEVTKDWLFPESRWLAFVQGTYQYDEFQTWRHRFGAYGGFGYEFIKEEDIELIGRFGVGTTYEVRGGRKFTPEALLGASLLRWNITENQTLTGSLTLYPNLEDVGEYRLNTAAEWVASISDVNGLSIKFGVENQHESDPLPGSRRNNFKYYGAVVFDF